MADPWAEAATTMSKPAAGTPPAAAPSRSDDWKVWQKNSQPASGQPEQRGFWGSFIGRPSDFTEGVKGLWNTIRHPIDTLNAMGQGTIDLGKAAVDSFKKGDVIGGVRKSVNTGVNALMPGLGVQSEAAGEKFEKGDYMGGLGSTAALGLQTAAGALAPRIGAGAARAVVGDSLPKPLAEIPAVEPPAAPHPFRADPRVAVTRALGPLSKDPNFAESIPDTLARVRQANGGVNPASVTEGKIDLLPAIKRTISQHQEAITPFMERAKGTMVSGDSLVEAAERAIPHLDRARDPAGTAAVIARVRDAFGGKQFPVETFKNWLETENADLNPFYRKSPDAQQTGALAGSTPAIEKALADATRDTLYRAIDPEGQGANIRTIQGATKNLYNFRDAVTNRAGAMVAQEPLSGMERVTRPLLAPLHRMFSFGPKHAAIGALAPETRVVPLLRRAFDAVGDQPVNALPKPASPLYPTGNPLRLLTEGDRITPPPFDTSYVRGAGVAPHQAMQMERPMLPAGKAPFSTSGVIVPDILGRPGQTTGRLLEAPAAGEPPISIQPRGPASVQGPSYRPSSAGNPRPLGRISLQTEGVGPERQIGSPETPRIEPMKEAPPAEPHAAQMPQNWEELAPAQQKEIAEAALQSSGVKDFTPQDVAVIQQELAQAANAGGLGAILQWFAGLPQKP